MKQESTREKILTKALSLFAVRGYEVVTVEEIAAAVGIKAPSLYKHYKSKRDIFRQIVARMEALDQEQATAYEMPVEPMACGAGAYANTSPEQIAAYSKDQFRYWTERHACADFRRLLMLEQYRDQEMAQMHRQYLAEGPLEYMTDVFRTFSTSVEEARQLALAFYGPMYLLYSVYDGAENKAAVTAMLDQYVDHFVADLQKKQ